MRKTSDHAVDQTTAARVRQAESGLRQLISESAEARGTDEPLERQDVWNHWENYPTFYSWHNKTG